MKRALPVIVMLAVLGIGLFLYLRTPPVSAPASTAKAHPDTFPAAPVSSVSVQSSAATNDAADVARTLDQALAASNVIDRSMGFGRAVRSVYATEPDAVIEYLRSMPDGNEFVLALNMVVGSMASNNPARAMELALELATNENRQVVFSLLFDQVARTNITMAADLMTRLPEGLSRDNSVRALASRWVDADTNAALAWATAQTNVAIRTTAMEAILFPVVKDDPWRALQLAGQFLDGDALERTVSRFLRQVSQIDPERASAVIDMIPYGETRSHAVLNVARALTVKDPEIAIAWVEVIEDADLKKRALYNVMDEWSAKSPAKAKTYVAETLSGEMQLEVVRHVTREWAGENAKATIAWANRIEDREVQAVARIQIASGWARNEPVAATAWAVSLPPGDPARAEAIAGALSFWVLSDAAGAVAYSESLSDPTTRTETIRTLATLLAPVNAAESQRLANSLGPSIP